MITTFQEYKNTFQERLEAHKAAYVDFDDETFIETETKQYSFYHRTIIWILQNECEDDIFPEKRNLSDRYFSTNAKETINLEALMEGQELFAYDNEVQKFVLRRLTSGNEILYKYDFDLGGKLEISFRKILKYLNSKKEELSISKENVSEKIKFHGTQTEFIELIKALILNDNLKGVQKEIIQKCGKFFDITTPNHDKLISDLSQRNNGSETLFIDKLKSSLLKHIQHKAEKK
ncbi:RteC domain-containing protein [Flavobacterium sp.]|uniref:RteC domain-containing protein n=1 Tax=Flavobacterium sp. TaxID=239 RepID=UPI003B998661